MKILLQELEINKFYKTQLAFKENLPAFIAEEFLVNVDYAINNFLSEKQLLSMNIHCTVPIFCERTGVQYEQSFNHNFTVAICTDEKDADSIMETFEPVIAQNNELDLAHIVLDEIILSCPRKQELLQEMDT